jgi:PBSX family phage terminase large subunit
MNSCNKIDISKIYKPIFQLGEYHKILVFKGGRGSGKTTGVVDSIVGRCISSKEKENMFIGRLTRTASDEAMYNILLESIEKYIRLGWFEKSHWKLNKKQFEFLPNGNVINITGFNELTIENIKSNNISLAWVEESARITRKTLDILTPSVRYGSKPTVVFSYNPQFINDPITIYAEQYQDSIIEHVNYDKNKYFKDNLSLVKEIENDNIKLDNGTMSIDEYEHKWLGKAMIESGDAFLLRTADVENCFKFISNDYTKNTIKMGVDVARYGDDFSVIVIRQGNKLKYIERYKNFDAFALSAEVMRLKNLHKVDYVMLDGDGLGAGTCDVLKNHFRLPFFEIHGGAQAKEFMKFKNAKTESYKRLADAVKLGFDMSILNNINTLRDNITQQLVYIPYKYSIQGQLQILPKEIIKNYLRQSPDEADALALTFANNETPELNHEIASINYEPIEYSESYDWY